MHLFQLSILVKKMIAFVRKNLSSLILKHTSPSVCRSRSPLSFAFSLNFFSTSAESQIGVSPTVLDALLHKHNFPPELASRVASKLRHLKTPEKPDSILSFFIASGYSNTQLVRMVKSRPRFLTASLEGCIKPKIKILQGVGFSSDDITQIITKNPGIFELSVKNNIIPSLSVLNGLLGSNIKVAKVVKKAPRLLTANFQNTVLPNVEFFKSCGTPMERIRIILATNPSCFTVKPEVMRKHADKAIKMGLDTNSKSFIYAIPTLASMSNEAWDLKLQGFRDLGFADRDILTMFRKNPRAFYLSIEKIKKVKELLLGTRKFNMCSIVNCPKSLESSIENRYIPRLRILEILESKNLIKNWPTLRVVSVLPDDKFFKKFICPFLNEVGGVYITKRSATARGNK